jgi:hypothetical protein
MLGLYNGLELALSIVENRECRYKDRPKPQRTWIELADEEIQECLKGLPTQTIDIYARRIEAKLKEKNT